MPRRVTRGRVRSASLTRSTVGLLLPLLVSLMSIFGCGPTPGPTLSFEWLVGQGIPPFDPQGPPDAVRWALERQLSRGLTERDTLGRIVPAAADSITFSRDSLTVTFRLRPTLHFTDGVACSSAAFARALRAGLARRDHTTISWLLGALAHGPIASRARVGHTGAGVRAAAQPIETPDAHTLVLHLLQRDPRLLDKLALPGVAVPWRPPTLPGGWGAGIGPYRVVSTADSRWVLARVARPPLRGQAVPADTLRIHFAVGAGRVHALLRAGGVDLAWPLPAGLNDLPPLPGYRVGARAATPERRLLLVMRADLPPTTQAAARHALAHGLNRGDLAQRLGPHGGDASAWLAGGERYEFATRSAEEIRGWLERGKLGRSLHVGMTYASDGVAGEVARGMQTEWARLGLDVELQAVRAAAGSRRWLTPAGAHLLLVEHQALLEDPASEMSCYVMSAHDGPVGSFRSGWRTREFDPWIAAGASRRDFDRAFADRRLAEEDIVLPLARLRWVWMERSSTTAAGFHPRFGPIGNPPVSTAAGGGDEAHRRR